MIEDTIVDGVDAAGGTRWERGVGIGMTWNARASVRRNLVRNYWKGIGVFVDASAEISGNVVEDVLTWGIALWDAGKGRPSARIEKNVVYRTGACGAMIAAGSGAADAGEGAGGAAGTGGANGAGVGKGT